MNVVRRYWHFLPGLVVVAVAIVWRGRDDGLGEHFGGGQLGVNNGAYTARIATNIARHGFRETRFGAPFIVIPTDPITIEHNLRHPSPFFLAQGFACRLIGARPIVLHLEAILVYALSVLAASAVVRWLHSACGGGAAAAGMFVAGVPLGAHYGFMAASHLPAVLFVMLASLGWFRWRKEGGRRWAWLLAIATSAACQIDWWGYCLFPALLLDLVLFERPLRLRVAVFVIAIAVLNAVVTVAHMGHVLGGFSAGVENVLSLGSEAAEVQRREGPLDGRWYGAIAGFLVKELTWPGAVIVALGTVAGFVTGSGRALLLFFVFGALNHFLLPWYASTHDYWMLFFWPYFGLAAGLAFDRLPGTSRLPGRIIAGIAMAALCFQGISTASRIYNEERWLNLDGPPVEIGAAINSVSDAGDMVFVPLATALLPMHIDASFCFGPVTTAAELDVLMDRFCRRPPATGRVLLVAHQGTLPEDLRKAMGQRKIQPRRRGPILVYDLSPR